MCTCQEKNLEQEIETAVEIATCSSCGRCSQTCTCNRLSWWEILYLAILVLMFIRLILAVFAPKKA
ncbi:MAG: hypothetical protein MK212_17830 [Saprospiraceae bacterium]|nr:hypothetical protein [Saprospiraceae bacterium]